MIFLAFRYLFERRRQTILTLLGIFLGTAAYVSISGFMLGFRGYLIDQLINNDAHVHIGAREEFLTDHSLDDPFYQNVFAHVFWDPAPSGRKDSDMVENPQQWYKRLDADPRVEAYSPQLTASVIFSNGKAISSSTLIGCDPRAQVKVTTLGDYVIEGQFTDLAVGGNRIVIGNELQKKLGLRVSQNVMVSLAEGPPTPFKIVGIFKTGNKLSDNVAYGALADVQKVNRTPNHVNKIAVRLHDHTQAAALAAAWAKISPERVESWDQVNSSIFDVFRIQDAVRFMSVGAVMIVAGFGIYNVLNMTVMHKRKDIAILRSMGYDTGDIIRLFFSQGLILGVAGTILGLTFSYFFCLYLQTIPFGGGPLGGGMGHLIVSFDPKIYIQSAILGLLSSTIASILPASSAGKLTPIEIIRAGAE
ncbi:MAG: ABC transporter permease [Candidatus Omnitrophota bacterium]|jgi:lipoprotein-releasing system permease protein|nr:ABC transporter permease [Candidatus Omnitrophota bacterium]